MFGILFLLSMAVQGQDGGDVECPLVRMETVRLPDMQIPRAGHSTFCFDGELVVMGGHTTGFVPTPTAEYFSEGEWHVLPMTYSHDQGFSLQLSSGKVMIGGGHEQPLGVGQTFSVDFYDSETRSFTDFGCLDAKRCFADAVELTEGRVCITGNWYYNDGVEYYDGGRLFSGLDSLSVPRSSPYIFRTSADDAIVFSRLDNYGHIFDSIVVESIRGSRVDAPLFYQWHPYQFIPLVFRSADSFIGDTCQGEYAYLLPVERTTSNNSSFLKNGDGELAVAQIRGAEFSLLPTAAPIPRRSPWGDIFYNTCHVLADRRTGRAYLVGTDEHHLFVLRIDYSQATDRHPAPVTLYHSDSLANIGYFTTPVLTPDGDIVLTGGIAPDNFTPTGTVYLLRVGSSESGDSVFVSSAKSRLSTLRSYLILGIALTIAVLVALVYFFYVRRHLVHSIKGGGEEQLPEEQPSIDNEASADQTRADQELMERIDQLMVERQFFKQADLKVQDIAAALGVHARRVSAVIKVCRNDTFVQFVNTYRVEYVKQLLADEPERKIASIWAEAGFASETSFFRTFKALTGMRPSEYKLET